MGRGGRFVSRLGAALCVCCLLCVPALTRITQKLEPAFSTITVTNDAGQRIDSGKARVSGSQMSISLKAGGTGTYHVNWRVLSVDTHTTDGNFTFQVGQ